MKPVVIALPIGLLRVLWLSAAVVALVRHYGLWSLFAIEVTVTAERQFVGQAFAARARALAS
jgi:hypothetical protein